MESDMTRRGFLLAGAALAALVALPRASQALDTGTARGLVD